MKFTFQFNDQPNPLFDKSLPRWWHKVLLILCGLGGLMVSWPAIFVFDFSQLESVVARFVVVIVAVFVFIGSPGMIALGALGLLRQRWLKKRTPGA